MTGKTKIAAKTFLKKGKLFQSIKGMADILPIDQDYWRSFWQTAFKVSSRHGFYFIETPILEPASLFEASIGATTDIVEKQMYVFKTPGGDRVALRPEGTAGVMRSYLQHRLSYFSLPLKVFYLGPMFRHEKPQAGRYRQFHQLGFEIIGDNSAFYDAEIILASLDFFRALGLNDLILKINSLGCRVCRLAFRQELKNYFSAYKKELCPDCRRRLGRNPLRILDCQEPSCRTLKSGSPNILDYLCQNCNNHFKAVLELIEDNGIKYELDPHLVRGLDYYNRTVFEFVSSGLSFSLGGGGRYDYLAEIIGHRLVPAVGISLGLERIVEALKIKNISPIKRKRPLVFFAAISEEAKKKSLGLMEKLRVADIPVVEALGRNSLKSQMKAADKVKSSLVLILGQKEIFEGSIIIKDLRTGAQENILLDKLVEEIKKRLS
ncbi:histidine--tRNA ligase [Candidatus Jorgensenbacteria bacterium CG_4_10_14_0_8_um_filter_39_13]|uniref:Histidine--tRNA ligase n=1 Tax=Candidatus Jorgensenbacteria bacterium CG_4_10_14_0_8_um_filter_39_13 TaxID=1974589 RepID=A0A2M7RH40_9BACT|nr:MAG: histidine--tRNA ligase [Candidatus Jorgensenbacteria bacterium CG_4_10_14_0_8_um_filter_39_13]